MPDTLNAWFNQPDLLRIQRDDLDFYLPPSARREAVVALLGHLDSALLASDLKKNTRHTNAGIVRADGGPLFIKRNNNWGLQYSLRYLFRPARTFRAAAAAQAIQAAGIHTPTVYGAGERRRGRYLKCCYLVTEALTDTLSLESLIDRDPSPALLADAGGLAAGLHAAGVYHGDMKLINLCTGWVIGWACGIWMGCGCFPARCRRTWFAANWAGSCPRSSFRRIRTQSCRTASFDWRPMPTACWRPTRPTRDTHPAARTSSKSPFAAGCAGPRCSIVSMA